MQSSRRMLLLFAVVAATSGARVGDADACGPPWGGVSERVVLPEDGATDVPLNARIYVLYDTAGGDPGSTLSLRVQGGADVALGATTPLTLGSARLLTPAAPLQPSATYELLDTLTLPCDSEFASDCISAAAVIATFTTGTAADTSAPSLTGVSLQSSGFCTGESCPDGEDVQYDTITIGAVADDLPTNWVQYMYLSTDGQVLAGPTSWLITGRGCGGGAGYFPIVKYLALPSTVDIRGVDLAGNVETTPHVLEGGTCDLIDCGPDAGPGAGGGPFAGAGCGCASGKLSGGDPVLVIACLGWLGLVRRRRAISRRAAGSPGQQQADRPCRIAPPQRDPSRERRQPDSRSHP